jgi:hypothetical protein
MRLGFGPFSNEDALVAQRVMPMQVAETKRILYCPAVGKAFCGHLKDRGTQNGNHNNRLSPKRLDQMEQVLRNIINMLCKSSRTQASSAYESKHPVNGGSNTTSRGGVGGAGGRLRAQSPAGGSPGVHGRGNAPDNRVDELPVEEWGSLDHSLQKMAREMGLLDHLFHVLRNALRWMEDLQKRENAWQQKWLVSQKARFANKASKAVGEESTMAVGGEQADLSMPPSNVAVATLQRQIVLTLQLLYRTITACFKDNRENENYIASAQRRGQKAKNFALSGVENHEKKLTFLDEIVMQVKRKFGAAECLTNLITNNRNLLEKWITSDTFMIFVHLIKFRGPDATLVRFLASLASCRGRQIISNQEMLLKGFYSSGVIGEYNQHHHWHATGTQHDRKQDQQHEQLEAAHVQDLIRNRLQLGIETALVDQPSSGSERDNLLYQRHFDWNSERRKSSPNAPCTAPWTSQSRRSTQSRYKLGLSAFPDSRAHVHAKPGHTHGHNQPTPTFLGREVVKRGMFDIAISWHCYQEWQPSMDSFFFSPTQLQLNCVGEAEVSAKSRQNLDVYLKKVSVNSPTVLIKPTPAAGSSSTADGGGSSAGAGAGAGAGGGDGGGDGDGDGDGGVPASLVGRIGILIKEAVTEDVQIVPSKMYRVKILTTVHNIRGSRLQLLSLRELQHRQWVYLEDVAWTLEEDPQKRRKLQDAVFGDAAGNRESEKGLKRTKVHHKHGQKRPTFPPPDGPFASSTSTGGWEDQMAVEQENEEEEGMVGPTMRLRRLASYYKAQLDLYAEMVLDRSYNCIFALEEQFSYELCITGVKNDLFPDQLRASFATLICRLYVDRYPHMPIEVPRLVRVLQDMREIEVKKRTLQRSVNSRSELVGEHLEYSMSFKQQRRGSNTSSDSRPLGGPLGALPQFWLSDRHPAVHSGSRQSALSISPIPIAHRESTTASRAFNTIAGPIQDGLSRLGIRHLKAPVGQQASSTAGGSSDFAAGMAAANRGNQEKSVGNTARVKAAVRAGGSYRRKSATERNATPFYSQCRTAEKFYLIEDFISDYFMDLNGTQIINDRESNTFTLNLLVCCGKLMRCGFYGTVGEVRNLMSPLIKTLDGRNDVLTAEDAVATRKRNEEPLAAPAPLGDEVDGDEDGLEMQRTRLIKTDSTFEMASPWSKQFDKLASSNQSKSHLDGPEVRNPLHQSRIPSHQNIGHGKGSAADNRRDGRQQQQGSFRAMPEHSRSRIRGRGMAGGESLQTMSKSVRSRLQHQPTLSTLEQRQFDEVQTTQEEATIRARYEGSSAGSLVMAAKVHMCDILSTVSHLRLDYRLSQMMFLLKEHAEHNKDAVGTITTPDPSAASGAYSMAGAAGTSLRKGLTKKPTQLAANNTVLKIAKDASSLLNPFMNETKLWDLGAEGLQLTDSGISKIEHLFKSEASEALDLDKMSSK